MFAERPQLAGEWRMLTARLHILPVTLVALLSVTLPAVAGPPSAADLAARIDQRLEALWRSAQITPAPAANDGEFLRRVSLDIVGRIPRVADVHQFLRDASADKRDRLVDLLLDDPRYAVHFANVWRAELVPEVTAHREAAAFQAGFEAWLQARLRAGVSYDRLVRELLTVPIASGKDGDSDARNDTPVLRDPTRPNPLAFFAVKEARPENLAAAVSRTFLGIRLECAQCHNHPFAKWSQEQFWQQAAFFAGIERQGKGIFAPLSEVADRRELTPPERLGPQAAEFLDGTRPTWKVGQSSRVALAEWVTSPKNPYFARAAANRLWAHFFGIGLVEPADDFRDDNPASDAETLEILTQSLVESGFDLKHLIRGICRSRAYQRTSTWTHASQDTTALPARTTVKALTPEQLFDSLALATGYRDEQDKGAARRQFSARFNLVGSRGEPETSVQQALTLLNGRFVTWATDPEANPTLIAVTQTPGMTLPERIEALYLATLSRKPSAAEQERLLRRFEKAERPHEAQQLADVFWVLLNSAEFRLNH
jgi:hypothetical protein